MVICLLVRNDEDRNISKDKRNPTVVHIHLLILYLTSIYQTFGETPTERGTMTITLRTAHRLFSGA